MGHHNVDSAAELLDKAKKNPELQKERRPRIGSTSTARHRDEGNGEVPSDEPIELRKLAAEMMRRASPRERTEKAGRILESLQRRV